MKLLPTRESVGHVLCHDITKIVPGEFKGAAYRKGHVVRPEDIEPLLDLGKAHLYVWEKLPGMLHEDEAADVLRAICQGTHMSASAPSEGKIELTADIDGLFEADIERLRKLNAFGRMMIATRLSGTPVRKGDVLAGMRVIPLVIEEAAMDAARRTAQGDGPLLRLHAYNRLEVGVINTGSELKTARITDGFTPVLARKLAEYGSEIISNEALGDDADAICQGIHSMIERGAQMVLCTGGMSVDPDDRTPLAIKKTGARIVSYGAPVLPGAMFMLGYIGDIPIVGLPGCVMYAGRTIFDLILPRLLAGLDVTADRLAALGHGGLCLNCASCIFPNCGFGRGV